MNLYSYDHHHQIGLFKNTLYCIFLYEKCYKKLLSHFIVHKMETVFIAHKLQLKQHKDEEQKSTG